MVGSSGGFKWKLARATEFGVWHIQFCAYCQTKNCLRWLSEYPDPDDADQMGGDEICRSQIVLVMKDAALIRMSASARRAKDYWDMLTNDFEGRIRIRKHEIIREERELRQKKNESFVDYCDRVAEMRARMTTAGLSTGTLCDFFILGLSEPFQKNNRDQLTRIAYESNDDALDEALTYVRQYSRLNPVPGGGDADGVALATSGRKFTGKCFNCGKTGHMQRHRKLPRNDKKPYDAGDRRRPAHGVPHKPAAALVCEGYGNEGSALAASHSADDSGVMLFDSCSTHHVVVHRKFLGNYTSRSDVEFMRMGGNEKHRVRGQGIAVLENGPSGPVVLQKCVACPHHESQFVFWERGG
jgi:hypothetical protein